MSDNQPGAVPANADLQEPSTEKEPGDEPEAPEAVKKDVPEPTHHATGIGVVDD